MEEILTPLNIISWIIGIIGVVLAVYKSINKPQEDLETKQVVSEKDIANRATLLQQKEMEMKASLLEQQVKLAFDANEKKFADLMIRMDANTALAQNHIHTVDTKVDGLAQEIARLTGRFIELNTIIAERIPKKNFIDKE